MKAKKNARQIPTLSNRSTHEENYDYLCPRCSNLLERSVTATWKMDHDPLTMRELYSPLPPSLMIP
jgi:hypothetical protein